MDPFTADEELPKCTVGIANTSLCHLLTFNAEKKLKIIGSFSDSEKHLLETRSNLKFDEESTICLYHEALLLTKFAFLQKYCCNPFGKRNHHVQKRLRAINESMADKIREFAENISPDQKLCTKCRLELNEKIAKSSVSSSSDDDVQMDIESTEKINRSFTCLGASPLKFQKVSRRDAKSYAKRKINQAQALMISQIASVGDINSNDLQSCQNCKDFTDLIGQLKHKLSFLNHAEQVQALTLIPNSWSIKKAAVEFGVSERMVKTARKLKTENDILAIPDKKKGRVLSDEIKNRVIGFFHDDEFSRICPGMKDCVSVRIGGEKIQKQKRLLLSNLKELFVAYRNRYGAEVSFSKFCELRPKWCVTASSTGIHSVCVCTIHQNIKLMLSGSIIKEDYKFLMSLTVCSLESRNCMLHRCDHCPGKSAVELHLSSLYKDVDPEEIIEFKQWMHTDRTTLIVKQLSTEEFIGELSEKLTDLSVHHFVAKHQMQYLKEVKDNLKPGKAVALMDFAENYSFVVQDAVQGFHWDNSQATVHPVVIYFVENGQMLCKSFCLISNSVKHDTIAVHVFVGKLVNFLKTIVIKIEKIFYFSDGSAAQYKNFKNFSNLCHHFKDYGIQAEWNFFATSHGKSPCDGVGGTVKRLACRASLQRPKEDQILTPFDLYKFCDDNLQNIKFVFVDKDEIEAARFTQDKRFVSACTVTGTRSNHQFVPIDLCKIQVSRVSGDWCSFIVKLGGLHNDQIHKFDASNLQPGEYVACIYDDRWWVGNICEVCNEQHDVLINFLHPCGPSRTFCWPKRNDSCWIPDQHIFAKIPVPPSCTTSTRRQYSFPEALMQKVETLFNSLRQ